ncbi:LysR family transcriptional regulator, partial [Enterobacter sp. DRP3]|nr:LysR family transcriptional regulator [Enterobacter sp. DRP3]
RQSTISTQLSALEARVGFKLCDRGRGGLAAAGRLPPVVLTDIRSRDRHGDFLAIPVEWAGTGKPPSIVLTQPRGPRKGNRPAAGIGDRALVRVERD